MLVTLMFSVVAVKARTLSSSPYPASEQVCRSWEGAWPDRQPSWAMEILHTIAAEFMHRGWLGGRRLSFILVSEFESSLGQEFELLCEFLKFAISGFAIAARGLAANRSSAGEKNCIVYSLVFIFIIIIIIFFVVLLNCLYLSP